MHFAGIHAERLQLVDLKTRTAPELYPPLHDTLRTLFEAEHAKLMPPQSTCEANENDSCDSAFFDESIGPIHPLKSGGFTFLASWDASHVLKPDEAPETVVSETNQYVYRYQTGKWFFCDVKIPEGAHWEMDALASPILDTLPCTPRIPVEADTSSADLSPFPKPEFDSPQEQKSRNHR